jgi:hypothetical protein
MRKRFKNQMMQTQYEACRNAAADKSSEFYLADGGRHGGASHRNLYWAGRDGIRPVGLVNNTLGYACWRAGMDDRPPTES